ncbi:hypothetical protein ACA910_011527 [Epithemia clementina (nom. ined.)]
MEESFPRGSSRRAAIADGDGDKAKKSRHQQEDDKPTKKRRRTTTTTTVVANDFLFGHSKAEDNKHGSKKSSSKHPHKRAKVGLEDGKRSSSSALAPLGGGGVVMSSSPSSSSGTTKKSSSSSSLWIESLGFSKLVAGIRLLSVVRQVHDELAVFSLPHHWTGFLLYNHSAANQHQQQQRRPRLQVGQVLAVTIVQAVQENTHGGVIRRRIQVSCFPDPVNAGVLLDSTTSPPDGTILRGQVQTIQDHGLVVDLGYGLFGFLPFDQIQLKYRLIDDEGDDDDDNDDDNKMDDNENENDDPILRLGEGSILDVQVHKPSSKKNSSSTTTSVVIPLRLVSQTTLAQQQQKQPITPSPSSLQSLQPGQFLPVTIEAWARNGACVQFGPNKQFRGAIERQHLGSFFIPTSKTDDDGNDKNKDGVAVQWKSILPVGRTVWARVLAVDPQQSKLVRFSLQSHLLRQSNENVTGRNLPNVGIVFRQAIVLRCDPGVGALLALPRSASSSTKETTQNDSTEAEEDDAEGDNNHNDRDKEEEDDDNDDDNDDKQLQASKGRKSQKNASATSSSKDLVYPPVSTDTRYLEGQDIQTVYVHISKAMDTNNSNISNNKDKNKEVNHSLFLKQFAPSTKHDVRILGNSNWLEGFASGATAPSIVNAHVVSYADLVPGQVYKQVRILRGVEGTTSSTSTRKRTTPTSSSEGVVVDFGLGVTGFISPHHLFDQVLSTTDTGRSSYYRSQLLKVKYATNAKVTVRVLTVNAANRKCLVTAKKSMVTAPPSHVLSSFDDIRVGQVGMGVVSKIDVTKGLYVTFFNNVHGFVPNRHLRQHQQQVLLQEEDEGSTAPSFEVGDVIKCRVLQKQQRNSHQWSLTLGLAAMNKNDNDDSDGEAEEETSDKIKDEEQARQRVMNIRVGTILPDKCLRVVELKECQEKVKNGTVVVIPGFALVEVPTKYLPIDIDETKTSDENDDDDGTNNKNSKAFRRMMPKTIECKLAFEQLVDDYPPEVVESAAALNAFAKKRLRVGQLVEGESLVMSDPQKSIADHINGIGKLTTLTLRPKFLERVAATQDGDDKHKNEGDSGHLYVGAILQGYVGSVDPRFGAFVHFSMMEDKESDLSGLVPKSDGGLNLGLYATVQTRVVAIPPLATVDSNSNNGPRKRQQLPRRRQKLLLSTNLINGGGGSSSGGKLFKAANKPSVGDVIETVEVEKITFHHVRVKVLDPKFAKHDGRPLRAYIHCTTATSIMSLEESPASAIHIGKKQSSKGNDDHVPDDNDDEDDGDENSARETWHKDHPFRDWNRGATISNLKVNCIVEEKDDTVTPKKVSVKVFLGPATPKDPRASADFATTENGTLVRGIISLVSKSGAGLWVDLSPSWSGFIPALEASEQFNIVQDLASSFKPGQRISAYVLGRRMNKARKNKGQNDMNVLLLSLITSGKDQSNVVSKSKKGSLMVGRVNRRKILFEEAAPTLVLDLPGGNMGRCCITELADPDEWVNFPLGNPLKQSPLNKPHSTIHDDNVDDVEMDDEVDDDSIRADATRGQEQSFAWGKFPHGALIRCCVLGSAQKGKRILYDVSCRRSRLAGALDNDKLPTVGEKAPAYVVRTNPKGCFLRISRHVEARVILKELSVGFVANPALSFPPGRLVLGKVKSVVTSSKGITGATRLDMDLRESVMVEDDAENDKLSFGDIKVGDKYMGTISRIEDYGAFVRLEKSDVSGLVHKSECSDNFVVNVASFYNPGDLVKVVVIRKVEDKKQLAFSMKASHFEDDDDESMEESSEEEDENPVNGRAGSKTTTACPEVVEDDDDDDDDDSDGSDDSDGDNDDDDVDVDVDDDVELDVKKGYVKTKQPSMDEVGLDTNVEFDWDGGMTVAETGRSTKDARGRDDESSCEENDDDEAADSGDSEAEDEDNEKSSSNRSSKRTQAARRREELATAQREAALADGTADESLETSADFERLLASNPNSSELWIRYMAFHLTLADVDAARRVAQKAFDRIEFREERDRMNVWCALLTLEVKYGSGESAEEALTRACQHVNPKHIHLRYCEILEKEGSPEAMQRMADVFARMCKKFRTKKSVWLANLKFLLSQHRTEDAFGLSKRALLSLPKYKHIWLLSHFALLLFEHKKLEQARAVFEGLLRENPKRADLLSLFMDQEVKHGEIPALRQLCTRMASAASLKNSADRIMKLSDKQMKKFFKRWFTIEETHGTEADREAVKTAARRYVEGSV